MKIAETIKSKQDKEATRKRLLKHLAELYSEKTHFIYELLQNAEDAGATRVSFRQYIDRLEVWHDGKPFTESNVQSLCDAFNSDKDEDKIGKFGVGFKSVFAICDTVELYSEPVNSPIQDVWSKFAIRMDNYTDDLCDIGEETLEQPYTTKFVFPYQCGDYYKSYEDLIKDVSEKLCNLGTSVLLFMKNIKEIQYAISGTGVVPDSNGVYMLDPKSLSDNCTKITALGETNRQERDEAYLVFSKLIPGTKRTVDLAFSITEEKGEIEFEKISHPFVFVYFPTETESRLNFIVQAPFDLTPNRSSLRKDSERNSTLINMITDLFKEAIFEIKAHNWLTLEFIDLWPYNNIYGPEWHFSKLHDMAKQLLEKEHVLPTFDGTYVSIKNAKIVRGAKLFDLFEGLKLCELLNEPEAKWLPKEFTESSPLRDLHRFLTKELKVAEIGTNELPRLIRNNPQFLQNVDDDWLAAFYSFLTENVAAMLGKNGDLAFVPFVKTADGTFSAPFSKIGKGTEAIVFVRPRNANFDITEFKFVDEFVEQNCGDFIEKLGLTEPNGFDYFIKELESMDKAEKIDADINLVLVKSAIKYLKVESDKAVEPCSRLLWVRAYNTKRDIYYVNPGKSEIYFEKDINNVSLIDYFTHVDCDIYILDEHFYLSNSLSINELKLLEKIGLKNSIYKGLEKNYWRDGSTDCFNIGDFKYHLNFEYIEEVLNSIDINKAYKQSAAIFTLLKNVEKHLAGQWQYGSTHPRYLNGMAQILTELKIREWLFIETGDLVYSSVISRYDLDVSIYGEIEKNSLIYELLGFKKTDQDKQEELVKKIISEFTSDEIDLFIQNYVPNEIEDEFDPTVDEANKTFPEESIKDLQRLIDNVKQQYTKAPKVQYEQVLRRVRTSRGKDKEHIRYKYRGYCQMCDYPSKFWEVVQIFNNPIKELEQMNLSLCPSCAAEYRQLRNNDSLMNKFANEIETANGNERVILGEKHIRFTQVHLAEVQTIIKIERNDINFQE